MPSSIKATVELHIVAIKCVCVFKILNLALYINLSCFFYVPRKNLVGDFTFFSESTLFDVFVVRPYIGRSNKFYIEPDKNVR